MTQGLYAKHDLDLMHEIQPIQYNFLEQIMRTKLQQKLVSDVSGRGVYCACSQSASFSYITTDQTVDQLIDRQVNEFILV